MWLNERKSNAGPARVSIAPALGRNYLRSANLAVSDRRRGRPDSSRLESGSTIPATSPTVRHHLEHIGYSVRQSSFHLDVYRQGRPRIQRRPFRDGVANDGQYILRTAALPPGDYYVYLKVARHDNSPASPWRLRAATASRIRIGPAAPCSNSIAPSFTSGAD